MDTVPIHYQNRGGGLGGSAGCACRGAGGGRPRDGGAGQGRELHRGFDAVSSGKAEGGGLKLALDNVGVQGIAKPWPAVTNPVLHRHDRVPVMSTYMHASIHIPLQ